MRGTVLLLLTSALAVAGCQSQWYLEEERPELVTTELTIRSTPTGAEIAFDGVVQETTPMMIPVEYHHIEEVWSRQTNSGAEWPLLAKVVLLPAWVVASFFHHKEDVRRHTYGANKHVLTAYLHSYNEAVEEVVLEGEARRQVVFELKKHVPR